MYFFSTLIPFQRFPIEIFYTHPMHCVVHYFRKGSVIVRNIDTEWLYVVKSVSNQETGSKGRALMDGSNLYSSFSHTSY